ncbi:MAG: glycosyltransferase family 2 protein [Flavobacteriaceae bacterium]|jgi:glycosyltransferase involved in cell wall biosynthesis|nr:glycosyltransferase family 2 protein [Flavobacteriaceae bacterium]
MTNYTIIIPHKNIPQLLQRCLDSIPRRDDVQIIIVDDNSDSDKVDFANFPAMNDPFVEIIFGKNENGRKGAGYARNLGLEKAKGNRLIFADADDFFMPCFNEVLDKYKDDENDIIYFNATSIDSETLQPTGRHVFTKRILDKVQKTKQFDLLFEIGMPWGKFIKREIVEKNKIQFQEYKWSNDVLFSVKCCAYAETEIVADDVVYCITARLGSLMNKHTLESMQTRFHSNYEAILYLRKHNKTARLQHLLNWWNEIYKTKKNTAIFLLPKMINACGLKFVYKHIIKQRLKNKYNKFFK